MRSTPACWSMSTMPTRFGTRCLQEAVYGDLLPGERVRLHARFAELLEQQRELEGPNSQVSMGELAHHRLASHDFPRAFVALVAAASEAEEVAAPAEALHHLEQALGIIDAADGSHDRLALLIRATQAAAASGDPARAVAHATAAVAAADAAGRRADARRDPRTAGQNAHRERNDDCGRAGRRSRRAARRHAAEQDAGPVTCHLWPHLAQRRSAAGRAVAGRSDQRGRSGRCRRDCSRRAGDLAG